MTNEGPISGDLAAPSWISSHVGRLLGALGGLFVIAILALFASLGFRPALYILVFFLSGLVMIILGGMIHRA